jgi:NAD(P)-dependent dehydrogenase (short-subunit alcohol dehydrogenase family)
VISTKIASIQSGPDLPYDFAAYGGSKAAINWISKKLATEYGPKGLGKSSLENFLPCVKGLTSHSTVIFPMHPGVVETELIKSVWSDDLVKESGGIKPEESARLILDVTDHATVEKDGGVFRDIDGSVIPW